jgi:hypothetical protein
MWVGRHSTQEKPHFMSAQLGCFCFPLGHLELPRRAKQLEQIVGKAYQLPFDSIYDRSRARSR